MIRRHRTEAGKLSKSDTSEHSATTTSHIPATAHALIGTVVDTEESGFVCGENQVRIEFTTERSANNRVTAELACGLAVVPGDRVLFVMPSNASLGVITSVLSPVTSAVDCRTPLGVPATSSSTSVGQQLVLRDTESLSVTTASGQTLVAIERGASGPIIRLGEGSLELDMPGELHLLADSLRFTTRSGPISLSSQTDDVVVQGRTIRLN